MLPVRLNLRALPMRWSRRVTAVSTTQRITTTGIVLLSTTTSTGTSSSSSSSSSSNIFPSFPIPQQTASLAGHSAIITGASRGIGWAIACRLAIEGVSCTLVGRNEETLQRAVEALPPPSPPSRVTVKHSHVAGDVRESSLWKSLFVKTDVHILVNAAGMTHNSLLVRMLPSEIHDVLDVNLYGTIAGCQTAMRTWLKNRSTDRCIINISSLLAIKGGYGAAVYAASKAGVIGLTRALAEEGSGRKIRSNVILPGYIETGMIANLPERQLADAKARTPLGRFGLPDEVADAALFLVKNGYANNCVLNLDGGLSAAT